MQLIIGIIVFGLILLAIIILVVINFTYKNFRQIREAFEERREMNQRMKEQKEKNPFGDDYFKSSDKGSKRQRQYDFQQKTTHQRKAEEPKETTARKTTTDSGVTIIDDRGEVEKKIFDHNDGEYVEFTEVDS
jgi:biopolymer transport protein ExbB/TolQ